MAARSIRITESIPVLLGFAGMWLLAAPAHPQEADHGYPTSARVEYVEECMMKNGADAANLYKCSCAIDSIAQSISYDEFVEASTFARYATLGGANAGIFRDSDEAKSKAKLYRSLEQKAYHSCGLKADASAPH